MPEANAATQLLLGLGFLLSIGANVALVYNSMRRKPPIDQTLATDYVRVQDWRRCQERCALDIARIETRQEANVREVFGNIREHNAQMETKLDNLQATLKLWQLGLAQQVGNIDGRLSRIERDNHPS